MVVEGFIFSPSSLFKHHATLMLVMDVRDGLCRGLFSDVGDQLERLMIDSSYYNKHKDSDFAIILKSPT